MNKNKFLIFVLTLIIILISIFSFHLIRKNKISIAQKNFEEWYYLSSLVNDIDSYIVKNDDWENHPNWVMYENSIIYHVSETIIPSFQGSSTKTFRFLCIYYDTTFRSLYADNLTDAQRVEKYTLLCEMNTELKEICDYVIETCDSTNSKLELINENSKIYKDIENRIVNYCDKYQ